MPNYMIEALKGYSIVDNIQRNKRMESLALEDREFNRSRIKKQDERADQEYKYQGELRQRDTAEYNNQMQLRDINAAEIEQIFGPEVTANPQAVRKAGSLMQDPARTGKIIAMHDEIGKYMSQGKNPPNELTTQYLNLVGSEELMQRGGDDGLTREVESVVPSNVPGEIMIGFTVTGKDGKKYKAPMTTGASADPSDNQVQSIPLQRLMEWGNGGAMTAKAIAIARAKAGDNSFLEEYRAAQQETAKRQQEMQDHQMKRGHGLEDYAAKKAIDSGYDNKKRGTDLADYEAKRQIDAKYKSKDGKKTVKANEDGSFLVFDQETEEAKVVYPPAVARQRAAEMAMMWGEEESAGILNKDKTEEEIKAKADEFYAELMGEDPEPMVAVTQNGQTFQVPAAMVPRQAQAATTEDKPRGEPKKKADKPKKKETPKSPAKKAVEQGMSRRPDFGLSKDTGKVIVGNDAYSQLKKRFEALRNR
jgi:hypothetical protein